MHYKLTSKHDMVMETDEVRSVEAYCGQWFVIMKDILTHYNKIIVDLAISFPLIIHSTFTYRGTALS